MHFFSGNYFFHFFKGLVLEVLPESVDVVVKAFAAVNVRCVPIGTVTARGESNRVTIQKKNPKFGDEPIISMTLSELRSLWEGTSFKLERFQCNSRCVEMEEQALLVTGRTLPPYSMTFNVKPTPDDVLMLPADRKPRVAIIRYPNELVLS